MARLIAFPRPGPAGASGKFVRHRPGCARSDSCTDNAVAGSRVFLLSPARLGWAPGEDAAQPTRRVSLAVRLREPGRGRDRRGVQLPEQALLSREAHVRPTFASSEGDAAIHRRRSPRTADWCLLRRGCGARISSCSARWTSPAGDERYLGPLRRDASELSSTLAERRECRPPRQHRDGEIRRCAARRVRRHVWCSRASLSGRAT